MAKKKLQERVNKLFSETRNPMLPKVVEQRPLTRMSETPYDIIMTFELPGLERKDIALEVTENRIKIRATKNRAEEERRKGFYRSLREARAFYYEETLPVKVIAEEAKSEYKEGIFKVTLPKKEKSN